MPQRRNEITSQIRSEPMAYIAVYNASNQVIHEAWADPGTPAATEAWVACKHTYDGSGNMTKTEWADGAKFNQSGSDLTTLTYT